MSDSSVGRNRLGIRQDRIGIWTRGSWHRKHIGPWVGLNMPGRSKVDPALGPGHE